MAGRWLVRFVAALNPWTVAARAKADAEAAERRLREALDALPTGVVFLDSELRYILWNKAYGEIYRRSSDLFRVGRPLPETLRIGIARGDYPAAVGREEEWLAERLALLRDPTGERHEQQIRDGRCVLIEERRTADGGVIGLRVDITDLKAQAGALEAALIRAETASRAKAEFLANMSHELKTPLNGVIGLGEVLTRSPLSKPQRQVLDEMLASAARLHDLLGDLLDFNALEAGRIALASVPFDPVAVARRAAARFAPAAQAKQLTLSVEPGPGSAALAQGDPERVCQVLEQLVANAVKFTTAGSVTIDVRKADGAWRYAVSDTGAGFDPADAERLFATFEMGDASATRVHGGAGIGLAICRRLAELMGGAIEANGAPGKGASFTLVAPATRAADEAPPG